MGRCGCGLPGRRARHRYVMQKVSGLLYKYLGKYKSSHVTVVLVVFSYLEFRLEGNLSLRKELWNMQPFTNQSNVSCQVFCKQINGSAQWFVVGADILKLNCRI